MWDVKYRPKKFTEVVGQPGSVTLLKKRLSNGTAFDTSYMFSGGHGQGKTTLARIFARAMLCLNLDKADPEPCNECDNCQAVLNELPGAFSERDAASQGTIDNMREIVEELAFSIMSAPKRIYLFDEAHRMGVGAQDVLLKPIEDKRMIGIFCTTEPDKIRGTIRSRCEGYTIRKVTRDDILARMKLVLDTESVEYQDDAVLTIIDQCGGHVRDILNKMEMVAQMGPLTIENVRDCLKLSVVSFYYQILLTLDNPKEAIALVEQACDRASPEDVSAGLAEAAMNSYRLANGMYTEFVSADRDLGKLVFDKYKETTILLASHFLSSRFTSRISLLKDVLTALSAPVTTVALRPAAIVSAPTPVVAAPVPTTAVAAAAPLPAAAAASPTAAAPNPPATVPPAYCTIPIPFSPLETEYVSTMGDPRKDRHGLQHLVFPDKNGSDDRGSMTPDEFRREFERTWPRGGGAGA